MCMLVVFLYCSVFLRVMLLFFLFLEMCKYMEFIGYIDFIVEFIFFEICILGDLFNEISVDRS